MYASFREEIEKIAGQRHDELLTGYAKKTKEGAVGLGLATLLAKMTGMPLKMKRLAGTLMGTKTLTGGGVRAAAPRVPAVPKTGVGMN